MSDLRPHAKRRYTVITDHDHAPAQHDDRQPHGRSGNGKARSVREKIGRDRGETATRSDLGIFGIRKAPYLHAFMHMLLGTSNRT